MAVDAINALDRTRDVIDRNRDVLEQRRLERLADDRLRLERDREETARASNAQRNRAADDARLERERAAELQADDLAERVRVQADTDRRQLADLDYQREAQRIEARRQDELDRIELR